MPGAPTSQRIRARSPTGPIPGSAATAPRPSTLIEAQGKSCAVPNPVNLSLSAPRGGEGRGGGGGGGGGGGLGGPPRSGPGCPPPPPSPPPPPRVEPAGWRLTPRRVPS